MRGILIPGQPQPEPAAESWPVDEHTIRVDEMLARQLDTEFSAGVRGLLHAPETGISAQRGDHEIPAPTRVGRSYNMPGGGYEMKFPYPIKPEFITVIK